MLIDVNRCGKSNKNNAATASKNFTTGVKEKPGPLGHQGGPRDI